MGIFLLQGILLVILSVIDRLYLAKTREVFNHADTSSSTATTVSAFAWLKSLALAYNSNLVATLLYIFTLGYLYRWSLAWHTYLLYSACTVVVFLLLITGRDIYQRICTKRKLEYRYIQKKLPAVRGIVWAIVGAILCFLIALCFFVPRWFSGYFGILTADQFIFLITDGGGDATADANAQVANFMIAPVFGLTLFGLELGLLRKRKRVLYEESDKFRRRLGAQGLALIIA